MLTSLEGLTFLGAAQNKYSQGEIFFSKRLSLRLQCEMDFKYYPSDTQVCKYFVRSCK